MALRQRLLLTIGLVIAAIATIAYLTRPKPLAVVLFTVENGAVKATVANTRVGTVKACRRAFLAPATGGQVAELNVREGGNVKRSEILMEVWNFDLRAQVALAKADLNVARAAAEQACFLAAGAEREAERLRRLQQNNQIVSEEAVDRAVTDAKAKRAACSSAKAAIETARARVQAAEAAVEKTLVRAPFDGVVAEVNAELGEFVTPSPPGIPTLPPIDLLDVSCLYVSAPIDEVDAPAIKTGMSAGITLDAFAGRRCAAAVSRIAPYVLEKEKQARTVEVEATITDPKCLRDLLPGYSADIEVLLDIHEKTLRIPTEAVLEGNRVLLYGKDGMLKEARFDPGLSNWEYTEVRAGLEAGERIVVSIGREGVKAGVFAVPEALSIGKGS